MQEWYAIQSKPHREFWASKALNSTDGVETYLPVLKVEPANPRARKIRPFFPGYLFARADLEHVGLSALRWTPGVARVVSYGTKPIPVPDSVIQEIRVQVAMAQEEDPFGLGQFHRGDPVRIKDGPFQGFEGMFDTRVGAQLRVRILVEFLGRLTATELDVRAIEKMTPRIA